MSMLRWTVWLGAAALCLGLLPASAIASGDGALLDPRARLARMHAAALERNYQGTMVFSASGNLSSSRVAHYAHGDQSFELIEALDGRMQRIYRHNDLVHTVWPQAGVVVIERRPAASGPGASLLQTVEARALDLYEMRHEGVDRVAGRDAEVLLLQPRDEWRYPQRLWADLASGLMLRADVLSSARRILESSAFSQIEIGIKAQAEAVLQPLRKLQGLKALRAQNERTQLEAEGWVLNKAVPGFQLTSCVRRPLEALPAQSDRPATSMVQAVFSDGLTHMSVFIERFDAERHRQEVNAQMGATATLMQRRGEHWLTAVGDVPPATLKRVLDAIERKR